MWNGEKAAVLVVKGMLAALAAVGLCLYAAVMAAVALPVFLATFPRFVARLAEPIPAPRFLTPVPGLRLKYAAAC